MYVAPLNGVAAWLMADGERAVASSVTTEGVTGGEAAEKVAAGALHSYAATHLTEGASTHTPHTLAVMAWHHGK